MRVEVTNSVVVHLDAGEVSTILRVFGPQSVAGMARKFECSERDAQVILQLYHLLAADD